MPPPVIAFRRRERRSARTGAFTGVALVCLRVSRGTPARADGMLADLRALGDSVTVVTDPDVVEGYRRDQTLSSFVPAGEPLAVVSPRTTADVSRVVTAAARHGVPIVPRGAGSGLAGGANAVDGGVVVDLTRMNQIIELDSRSLLATVQPGVINTDLKNAAAAEGLWYAPDPASQDFSTIGGNVATNAGGLCCVKYGVTRDAVLGVEVVLADGQVCRVGRRTRKGVAGYNLVALLVGSEGTLGVITEVTVRLVPRPAPATTVVASFADLRAAGAAIGAIAAGTGPSMLEIIDEATLAAIEAYCPIGLDVGQAALVLAQSDLGGSAGQLEAEKIAAIAAESGAGMVLVSEDPAESEALLQARRIAYTALEAQGITLLDDVTVPLGRMADLLAGVRRIADRFGIVVGTFGHAGDGNMHPTLVVPHGDSDALVRAAAASDAIVELACSWAGPLPASTASAC
jgi:glycolate oxidase